jgi:hypothetical protein
VSSSWSGTLDLSIGQVSRQYPEGICVEHSPRLLVKGASGGGVVEGSTVGGHLALILCSMEGSAHNL